MAIFENFKTRMIRKYYTTHSFPTIDPEAFLRSVYEDVFGENGEKKFNLTTYADTMLDIANKMLKCSDFEEVIVERGRCCVNNDTKFFELTKEFWNVYDTATGFYKTEIFLDICGWYDKNLTKSERELCHTSMAELIDERDVLYMALWKSQQEKRLLTSEEKTNLLEEYNNNLKYEFDLL